MQSTITPTPEARVNKITRAQFALERAREELIVAMRNLDEAGEQATAHRFTGSAVGLVDDARGEVVQGERRFRERAAADDERERQS